MKLAAILLVAGLPGLFLPGGGLAQSGGKTAGSRTEPRPAATSVLRVACDGPGANAEISINGVFKGECPVDISVAEGTLKLRAVKKLGETREQVFEQEIRIAADTVKRVNIEMGAPQLTAVGRRQEADRERQALEVQEARLKAEASVQSQAEAGDAASMVQLAAKLKKTKTPANDALALGWYRKAAALGHPEAMGMVGAAYVDATDGSKNEVLAEQWFRKGALAGDGRSMNGLGALYIRGAGGLASDEALAREWILKAVDKGFPQAMRNLGVLYARAQDPGQALAWYRKAADLGNGDAMRGIGNAYEKGLGVPADNQAALQWYLKAAALDNTGAMLALGHFYTYGVAGSTDEGEATNWYRKSAELGDTIGMNFLALRYYVGQGTEKSTARALEWFRKSAAAGNDTARRAVSELEQTGMLRR